MTVLFADVVRSMDIAAALDPERWRAIMSELAERSAAVVRRYGGTVEFIGDGVMAIFGAPVALEDHAFRGVSGRPGHPGTRRSGSPSMSRTATAWTCSCGWA